MNFAEIKVFPTRMSSTADFSGDLFSKHKGITFEQEMKYLRGDLMLPHDPDDCEYCYKIFRQQISYIARARQWSRRAEQSMATKMTRWDIMKAIRELRIAQE